MARLKVMDNTGDALVIIFDDDLKKLFNSTDSNFEDIIKKVNFTNHLSLD